ncbi:MAG: insulinase family protein [Geobacter sp.]|nr:insulinase family protein [Geobacter sp.]
MLKPIRTLLIFAIILLSTITAFAAEPFKPADPRNMSFPPLKFEIPKAERVVLENGMVVYLMEDHELSIVNISAIIGAGGVYEPAEKTGLAGIAGTVMRSGGTSGMPPEQMDSELEFMSSSVETSIGADSGGASMACLRKNLDKTLRIFAQVLTTPAFRQERVDLAKNQTIEGLRRQNDNPKAVGDRELGKLIYSGHPLGRVATIQTVSAITRDDLVAFHARYYRPNNVILAVSGDFARDEMLKKLRDAFAGWEKKDVDFPKVDKPSQDLRPGVYLAKKDIPQSVIRMGHVGVDKDNPDVYAIRVMDYILGGGFTSRLVLEVRTNQGLAYNVDGYFDIGRRFAGIYKAETETKSESTVKAAGLMRDIIAGMMKEQVTEQELALAKDSIINSFIFGFANTASVVSQRARLEYYGYKPGYLENFRDNIAKVTREDVLRVAKRYLHPEALTIVVVGDPAKFDKPLVSLGEVREIKLEDVR